MTGSNELKLNQATMVEALQVWVNSVFVNPPTVVSVEKGTAYADGGDFCVTVQDDPEEAG